MKIKDQITIVGETANGMPVVAGLYYYKETHGLPLVIMMDFMESRGYVISILDYIMEALVLGQNYSSVKAEVIEALTEKYGPKINWQEKIDALGFTE